LKPGEGDGLAWPGMAWYGLDWIGIAIGNRNRMRNRIGADRVPWSFFVTMPLSQPDGNHKNVA